MHHFDKWGWYTAAQVPGRSTDIDPPSLSETTTPGAPRANWTGIPGAEWQMLPYAAPVIDTPPVVVPERVTMRQGRDALILAGLDEAVDAAIDAIQNPIARKRARNAWMNSNEFERNNGFIAQLGPAIGLTDAQIDQLFITAATL